MQEDYKKNYSLKISGKLRNRIVIQIVETKFWRKDIDVATKNFLREIKTIFKLFSPVYDYDIPKIR